MISRIVKMTFRSGETENFRKLFDEVKHQIRGFEGCTDLRLLQGMEKKEVFFTYSCWIGEEYLEAYRKSPLFEDTWKKTKALFADKPEAWTVTEEVVESITTGWILNIDC